MKIIAKKPDALYIVDNGVNFVLADFNTKKMGNCYIHERIMKVDLKTFGLSVVAEYIPVEEYNNKMPAASNAIFHAISISGNIGFSTGVYTKSTLDDEE